MVSLSQLTLSSPIINTLPTGTSFANGRLSSDVTTTNLTATTVAGLNFSIGVSEVWSFEMFLNIGSSSAAGTKYTFTFPVGATLLAICSGTTSAVTANTNEKIVTSGTLTTTAWNTASITTAALSAVLYVNGVIVNGANAGVLQFQQAKVTSGTASVYANSYFTARRIG